MGHQDSEQGTGEVKQTLAWVYNQFPKLVPTTTQKMQHQSERDIKNILFQREWWNGNGN